MTRPQLVDYDRVADVVISDSIPVLLHRELRPGHSGLSLFGDHVWDLHPAIPDRHSVNQSIHWNTYPEQLRHACKLYVFALINVIEHAPRFPFAGASVPSIKTIWSDMLRLRRFLCWLADRGIARFADVTETDLDLYFAHVMDQPISANERRKALLAVQRLHLYRNQLPGFARLPGRQLWGGATAAQLAGAPDPRRIDNRTPRIHPDVMGTLLSAALLVIDTVAEDLLPVARRLVAMRALAVSVAPPSMLEPIRGRSRWFPIKEHLERVLPAFVEAGHALPGRQVDQRTELDIAGLALAALLDRNLMRQGVADAALDRSGLPIHADLLRVTQISRINNRPWRDRPIETSDLLALMRHISTACYIAIAYLSGLRPGEVLNLARGCVTHDPALHMIFLSGRQLKTSDGRAVRTPSTVPWVINEQGARAVAVLEALSPSQVLFPAGKFGSPEWLQASRTRITHSMNDDIQTFIDWFNTTISTATGHPKIEADPHGPIIGSRFRRTLAWHIVRRPGGTIAGAQQYGHLGTQITHGYAGQGDSGFTDELTFEEFLLRAEQIYDDHHRLNGGEHVSGPAADLYRERVAQGRHFHGMTITTTAQAGTALANTALQIHHGALLTCVWRSDTAACRNTEQPHLARGTDVDGPSWPRCRSSCTNIARTDRDIAALREHTVRLRTDLTLPGLPEPLRRRITERVGQHDTAITNHQNGTT